MEEKKGKEEVSKKPAMPKSGGVSISNVIKGNAEKEVTIAAGNVTKDGLNYENIIQLKQMMDKMNINLPSGNELVQKDKKGQHEFWSDYKWCPHKCKYHNDENWITTISSIDTSFHKFQKSSN